MEAPPLNQVFLNNDGSISQPWTIWLSKIGMVGGSVDGSGTTANRPTSGLFVGRPYYDTTLGKPIWLESVRPTVWVDSTGTPI